MTETDEFLERHGFGGAIRTALAGDASARRYERLIGGPKPAILMHCPPQIRVEPFLSVADWLHGWRMSAPEVLAADAESGQVLLEDLGDDLFSRALARGGDERGLYEAAVDLLVELQPRPPPEDLPAYDDASLLEDARRDVPPELANAMVDRYLAARPDLDPQAFRAAYAVLGAQRNAKILG